ncbi:hypothetical protein GCM10020370_69220 [Paenibacillus hodogayensis]
MTKVSSFLQCGSADQNGRFTFKKKRPTGDFRLTSSVYLPDITSARTTCFRSCPVGFWNTRKPKDGIAAKI